jgi:hypothetical protein
MRADSDGVLSPKEEGQADKFLDLRRVAVYGQSAVVRLAQDERLLPSCHSGTESRNHANARAEYLLQEVLPHKKRIGLQGIGTNAAKHFEIQEHS